MAFIDKELFLYNGALKITYLDRAHRYYRRERINWELHKDDPKAWGGAYLVSGVTTMMDGVLEKKGLMTWPMGLALGELFGFYNFKNDQGETMIGFSRDKGTMWEDRLPGGPNIAPFTQADLLPFVKSASEAWSRQKKKGADIGSVVHDAIEHFVKSQPFSILETYTKSVEECEYEDLGAKQAALDSIVADVLKAESAFGQFKKWWAEKKPELLGAEELLYSREMDYCGTYDGLLGLDGKRMRSDWKTSNASKSRDAAAPQGVYYSYFIQLGFYEAAAQEMGQEPSDDLLCVSCRKDGGFDTVLASQVGLSVQDCINWAKAVWLCYGLMKRSKAALLKGVA